MKTPFKTLLSSAVVVIASVASFNAFAQTPAAPAAPAAGAPSLRTPGKGIKALDTNKDGQISRDEAKGRPRLSKNFDAIDTNKDGQLSRDELKAYRQAHKGEAKARK